MNDKALERRIRQHVRGPRHTFFAVTHPAFAAVAAQELRRLGIDEVQVTDEGGVEFRGRLEDCWQANLAARTINRILMRLFSFESLHFSRIRSEFKRFPWELHLRPGAVVYFHVTAVESRLYHTERLAEEAAAGLQRRLGELGMVVRLAREEDGVDTVQQIHLRLFRDRCQVSLDSSGDLLYRRGVGKHIARAPLRETLAASILLAAGWPQPDILYDPMCGAGTFLLEGAGLAAGAAAGAARRFAFELWPAFRSAAFAFLKRELVPAAAPASPRIYGADIDRRALEAAAYNAAAVGLSSWVTCERRDFFADAPVFPAGKRVLLVCNPPYGERLPQHNTQEFYRRLGERLRRFHADHALAVVVPGEACEAALALEGARKIPFSNGGLKVALLLRP